MISTMRLNSLRMRLKRGLVSLLNRLPQGAVLAIREGVQLRGRLDYPRTPISLTIDNSIEYHVRLHSCTKEPETVGWIEGNIRPGDVLYDVGANVGAYSLLACKFAQGQARVYAFEPGFATYAKLCQNVIENGCQENIVPIPVALADLTRLTAFTYTHISAGAAEHVLGDRPPWAGAAQARQAVLAFQLDEWIGRFDAPPPTCLKIDVDGGEVAVLQGAARTLTDPRLRTVLVEVGSETEAEVDAILRTHGLRLSTRHPRSVACNCVYYRNPHP